MTKFKLISTALDMWMHQNAGEIVDSCEGCLVDNLVVGTKRGTAFIYESYQNTWGSNYLVYFAPAKDKYTINSLWSDWDAFVGANGGEEE